MSGWTYIVYEPADSELASEIEAALDRAEPPEVDSMSSLGGSGDDDSDVDDDRHAPAESGATNDRLVSDGHGDTRVVLVGGYNLHFDWEDGDAYKTVNGVNRPYKHGQGVAPFVEELLEGYVDYETAVVVTANDTSDTAGATVYREGREVDHVSENQRPPAGVAFGGLVRAYIQREYDIIVPTHNGLYQEMRGSGFECPDPLSEDTIEEWLDESDDILDRA